MPEETSPAPSSAPAGAPQPSPVPPSPPGGKPRPDPAQDEGPAPTHDLTLSGGRTVPSHGAIPTHYSEGDEVFRVVRVTKR